MPAREIGKKSGSPTHPSRHPAGAPCTGAEHRPRDRPGPCRRRRPDRRAFVVVFGHCALLPATIDRGGVRIANILGALPALAPVTWAVQVMPLFFLAGGAAGAYGWCAANRRDQAPTWGGWLMVRAQRLCRPLFCYLGMWAVALLTLRLTVGGADADRIGREVVALLWFLGVYLIVLALVPAMTRLRTAAAPMVLVVAFCGQLILAATGRYEVALVVTGIERVSNVSPPTLVLALQCTWMSCAFVVAAPAVRRLAERPWTGRAVLLVLAKSGLGGAVGWTALGVLHG